MGDSRKINIFNGVHMKTLLPKCIFWAVALLLVSCQPIPLTQSICQQRAHEAGVYKDSPERVAERLETRLADGRHVQKIDNLVILVDDASRLQQCQGQDLIRQRAYDLIDNIDATLDGIPLDKAIRIFGPLVERNSFSSSTAYGMGDGIDAKHLKPSRMTITPDDPMLNPLSMALEATYHELKGIKGNTAVILLSDFESFNSEVHSTLDMISQYYGDRLCLYGIFLGDDKHDTRFENNILGVNLCGFFSRETALANPTLLTDFLEKVVYDIAPVPEPVKKPAVTQTEKPLVMPAAQKKAEPAETKKPEISYKKLKVEKELRIELNAEFDLDKAIIKPEYVARLKEIADFMKKYRDTTVEIDGYTCNLGTAAYNMKLSQRRAESIKNYLVEKLGVERDRIAVKAYGETRPIADNSTEEGRKKNRRAEAVITTVVVEEVDTDKK